MQKDTLPKSAKATKAWQSTLSPVLGMNSIITKIHMNSLSTVALIALYTCLISSHSQAAVIYSELVSGDLSGTPSSPELLVVGPGINTIIGSVGENGDTGATDGSDADYFTLTIPFGLSINTITIDNYFTAPNPAGRGSFLAYKAGVGFSGQEREDIDARSLFDSSTVNLLTDLGLTSLEAGSHSFWIQETDPTVVDYTISYEAVPEPSTYFLIGVGLVTLVVLRKRAVGRG
ncbi:MAG: PEP-CTERM sorting domain-containing protein [Verrucomicrobiota bacterium]